MPPSSQRPSVAFFKSDLQSHTLSLHRADSDPEACCRVKTSEPHLTISPSPSAYPLTSFLRLRGWVGVHLHTCEHFIFPAEMVGFPHLSLSTSHRDVHETASVCYSLLRTAFGSWTYIRTAQVFHETGLDGVLFFFSCGSTFLQNASAVKSPHSGGSERTVSAT